MENTNEFEHFDEVPDDSDHHFLGSKIGKQRSNDSKSGVYKAIMREWKTLQKNLPDSIYVRVYERRIDLMRAVIVGAAGTPYHDGLFFFDILFPYDYPNRPPNVRYHSFGYEVNPNISTKGSICLSLLNTWPGRKTEMWVPSQSTILQVLLSIQGLVLNENPYYNEAGTRSSDTKSRFYNEQVFLNTHKTSLNLLQRPPRNFEAFVRVHFRDRGFSILSACKEYVNGRVRVGHYSSQLHSSSSSTVSVSRNFKEAMMQFYPRLVEAFRRNGTALEGLVEHLVVDITSSDEQYESKCCSFISSDFFIVAMTVSLMWFCVWCNV